jgi:hypothetical protein
MIIQYERLIAQKLKGCKFHHVKGWEDTEKYITFTNMKIEVSNGEIVDKMTILELKLDKIANSNSIRKY